MRLTRGWCLSAKSPTPALTYRSLPRIRKKVSVRTVASAATNPAVLMANCPVAEKREMTNQPTKVLTCQRRKSAPSTTTVVSRTAATVRTNCEVGAPAHPATSVGPDTLGRAGAASLLARGFSCESPCGAFSSSITL
jgi:hypothetical protein